MPRQILTYVQHLLDTGLMANERAYKHWPSSSKTWPKRNDMSRVTWKPVPG